MTGTGKMFEASVIVAVKHPAEYLYSCLESLQAQTLPPKEVLLIETGGMPASLDLSGFNLNIKRIQQDGSGLAQAWNQGMTNAQGGHIAFLDSDDQWTRDCLSQHEMATKTDGYKGASVGNVEFKLCNEVSSGFRKKLLNSSHLAYMPGCAVFSLKAIDEIGHFREDLGVATDIEWFARARELISFIEIPATVLTKRVHSKNLSFRSLEQGDYQGDLTRALYHHINRGKKL